MYYFAKVKHMSIQYTDGSFSDNMPLDEAVDAFHGAIASGTARALYIGTPEDLDRVKKKASLEKEIEELKGRISDLEDGPLSSDSIVIPTRDEIIKLAREGKK